MTTCFYIALADRDIVVQQANTYLCLFIFS